MWGCGRGKNKMKEVALFQHFFGMRGPEGHPHIPATPINLLVMLRGLRTMTDRMIRANIERVSTFGPDGVVAWTDALSASLSAWNDRLNYYESAVLAAPRDDAVAVLWTVTAPLLAGHYRGEDGLGPVRPGAWTSAGPPAPSDTGDVPDLRTPFILGAELGELSAGAGRPSSLGRDFVDAANEVGRQLGGGAGDAVVAVGRGLAAIAEGAASGVADSLGVGGLAVLLAVALGLAYLVW